MSTSTSSSSSSALLSAAAEREARRKARQRGNPERARFHRSGADENEFEIKVKETYQCRDSEKRSSAALIRGMRRISLDHRQAVSMADGAQSSVYPSRDDARHAGQEQRKSLAPKPAARTSSLLAGVAERSDAPEADNESDFHMDECEAETADNIPDNDRVQISADETQSNIEYSPEPEPKQSARPKKKPAAAGSKARRRMREDIDTNGIEHVLEQAPARMTRSMARMAGGVQPPRRYFGEGVSTSQILRTKHEQ